MKISKASLLMILIIIAPLTIPFSANTVEAHIKTEATQDQNSMDYTSDNTQVSQNYPTYTRDGLSYDEENENQNRVPFDRNEWDFNETNEWMNFVDFKDGSIQLVIGLVNHQSYAELTNIASNYGGEIVNSVLMGGRVNAVVVNISLTASSSFIAEIRTRKLSRYIEPNMIFNISMVPNDPYWVYQWGPKKIEADWAWNITVGNHSILVAVIDTGIDYTHPDLAANYVPLGYDWVNNDTDPMDDHGHGTHCAGIIAAVLNNSIGIAGLAQVSVMAEKALNYWGWGTEDWLASAIIHATDMGADIISMSWGGYFHSELIYEAIKYAYDAGVLLVAAAGNEATSTKSYPAGYGEVIAVAATDENDYTAWWSNFGDWIELAAPGVNVFSTVPWGYESWSGTSMACPHVAGVAALAWSVHPNKTRDWVRLWLRYTADDLGDSGFDVYYGYGRINARKAVEWTPPEHDLVAYSWQTPPYVEPLFSATINATVLNFGGKNETNIEVQLLANDTLVNSASIDFLASGSSKVVNITWNPTLEGLYNLTLYIVPVSGEVNIENNILQKYIYVGLPVKAVVLHSAGNIVGDIIANWQVLNSEWYKFGDTMIYIDYTTLNKECITYDDIAATEADVLIISCASSPYAGWEFKDSEIEAIEKYVHEGHGLIATAGTLYYRVPNNNKLAPLFGLNETVTWYATWTDLMHILNVTYPLFNKMPNPFVFADVGTAIPSDWHWDSNELAGGKYLAMGHYGESAIVTYRGLVYISPWLEIIPAYYHYNLQLLYNAIVWSRYQKPEHELITWLECPRYLKPGETVVLNATVINLGLKNETNVELYLQINGSTVSSAFIPKLQTSESHTINYTWTPTKEATYNVTAYTPPKLGEEFIDNNKDTVFTIVTYKPVIGIIETHGENLHTIQPLPYYKSLGYIVERINATLTLKVLNQYDILFIGEDWWNTPWSPSEITAVESFINSGGGFIAIGDELATPVQEILNTYGISYIWQEAWWGASPYFDHEHPIMQGVNLIYAGSPINSLETAAPAYWIANDASNTYIIIAGADVTGHVLCLSDDFAAYLYYEDNEIMFKNIVEWAGPRYEHDIAVTLEAPEFLEVGKSALLNVTVRNKGLSNETEVALFILINDTVVVSETIPELKIDAYCTISYTWTPSFRAKFNITTYAPPLANENVTYNNYARIIVDVRPPIFILIDQTHGTDTLEYYGSWMETLAKKGYIIETNDFSRIEASVLAPYDIFIIPQARISYTLDEIDAIQQFVLGGGGLLVIGDDYPNIYTSLTSFAGIAWDYEYYWWWGYTTDITPHSVTKGVKIAYFDWPVSQLFVSSPAQDLIRDGAGYGEVMLAVSEVGLGKVVCIADEGSIRDYYIDYADNRKLAVNMVKWLFTLPEHDLHVSLEAQKFIEPYQSALVNATVRNRGSKNETVNVSLLINGTLVECETVQQLGSGCSYTLSHLWTPTVKGLYNITAYAQPVLQENITSNNVATKTVEVLLLPKKVAVLGDYESQLTTLLRENGINVEERSWDVIGNIHEYDVVVINRPNDPGYETFMTLLGEADNYRVSLVFTSSWPGLDAPYGISLLQWYLGDPEGQDCSYWDGPVYYQVVQKHPIFKGWNVGDQLCIIYSGWMDYAWFWEYSGVTIANIGAYYTGIRGGGIAYNIRENGNKHLLLAGLAPQCSTNIKHWTHEAKLIFLRGVIWARPPEHDVAIYNVTASPNKVYVGQKVNINVTVANEGEVTESFKVEVYYHEASNSTSSPVEPHPADAMWIEPSEKYLTTVSVGYRFNVTIWVNCSKTSTAWQFMLYYNSTYLNATGCWYTAGTSSEFFQGLGTIPVEPVFGPNYVLFAESCVVNLRDPGYGSLAFVEFEFIEVPPEQVTFELDISTAYPEDTYIVVVLDGGEEGKLKPMDVSNAIVIIGLAPPTPPTPPSPVPPNLIGQATVELPPSANATLNFVWNTSGVPLGNYTIEAVISPVQGEIDTEDNTFQDGIVQVLWQHDVAVLSVEVSSTWVYQGWPVFINITAINKGDFVENITLLIYNNFAAGSVIGDITLQNVQPGENVTVTFIWDTTGVPYCINYTITVKAEVKNTDGNPYDNVLQNGSVKVRIMGDVNGDDKVDIADVSAVARAFGAYRGHLRWDPTLDLDRNQKIDITDVYMVAKRFGICVKS